MLEFVVPDPATRREYLATAFTGVEPSSTHERLAELAARGMIRVFGDNELRLLGAGASSERNDPVVVTSERDLAKTPSREHSSCYVSKAHSDYLQQTIRNTPAELVELEPETAAALEGGIQSRCRGDARLVEPCMTSGVAAAATCRARNRGPQPEHACHYRQLGPAQPLSASSSALRPVSVDW